MTKMHLMWFCAFSPHAGFGMDGWSGPQTGQGYDWTRPELWQDMAIALERAKFDLIMLGDSLAVPGTYRGRMDAYLRYAEHAPFHDPCPLVAIMAAATRRIGLAATLSTTFYPPFLLARLMTTLDHLSRGRVAWNVVTSYKVEEALNFGYQELLDHASATTGQMNTWSCAHSFGRAGSPMRWLWTPAPTPLPIRPKCER